MDEIFISQPASTFPATDAKQFYVSVSRARNRVHIYTDDKEQLLYHASELGERQSAIELVSRKNKTDEMVHHQIRDELNRTSPEQHKTKQVEKDFLIKSNSEDYEPRV